MIFTLFSAQSFANQPDKTKEEISSLGGKSELTAQEPEESENKNVLIQGGFFSGDIASAAGNNKPDIDLNGFELFAGNVYSLTSFMEGVTSLGVRVHSVDIGEQKFEVRGWDLLDLSISQKLSFVIQAGTKLKLKPFLMGGLGRGSQKITLQVSEDEFNDQAELKNEYTRVTYGAGIDFEFSNGITPFFQYQISQINFSNETEVVGNLGSVTIDESLNSSGDKLQSQVAMLGLGYRF